MRIAISSISKRGTLNKVLFVDGLITYYGERDVECVTIYVDKTQPEVNQLKGV